MVLSSVVSIYLTLTSPLLYYQLKFHLHTTEVAVKANRLLGLIKKSFDYLDSDMLTKLFTAFVRPTLEYSSAVWGPFFVLDQRKVEKVQCRATRLLPSLRDKPYEERLAALQLPSLAHRRHRGDMILLYKTISIQIFPLYIPTPIPPLQGGISLSFSNVTQD